MSLKNLGEDGLIRLFSQHEICRARPGSHGIGDDCAVLAASPEGSVRLVTTDLLVEGVQFLRDATKPEDVGHKSLAVNLSDIAAGGGSPRDVFLSLACPPDLDESWIRGWWNGFSRLAASSGVVLMGGDTTRSPGPIFVSVTVIGDIDARHVKHRSGGRAGDAVYVTGTLGDSAEGWEILRGAAPAPDPSTRERLVTRHVAPTPRLAWGAWLGARGEVRAMMDLSDGLSVDLGRLSAASQCGACIEVDRLPLSDELRRSAGARALERAVYGGEDYELLFVVDAAEVAAFESAAAREVPGTFQRIGRLTAGSGLSFERNGQAVRVEGRSFEHF